jgi:hypothetical protein
MAKATVKEDRAKMAAYTRWYRKWHKYLGLGALVLFVIVAATGILLAWNKNSGGYLLADTAKGSSNEAAQWRSLALLQQKALYYIDSLKPEQSHEIDRIDIRPDKGVAKFTFKAHFTGLQLDLATGMLLSHEVRHSDFIERLHDGSLLDQWTGAGFLKLLWSSLAGLALLFLSWSGLKLWWNPRRIRQMKQ